MTGYAVKEMFLTLQGEGVQTGRRAVFLRFAGCNLWSGREQDRDKADCTFCDTDFVGTEGDLGGRYPDADALANRARELWDTWMEAPVDRAFIVLTGGEPMLQIDAALIDALHARAFEIAVESNGTLPAPEGIDWLCISPKRDTEVVQRSGDELKLVWPQPGIDYRAMEDWDFRHLMVQPLYNGSIQDNTAAAIKFVILHPKWRLTTQVHKSLGLR